MPGQNLAVQTLAAKVLQLDLALADYGPEASGGRALLRQELAKTLDAIWNANLSDSEFAAHNFAAAIGNLRHQDGLLKSLDPSTDDQKQALASARQTIDSIGQSRLQMSFALYGAVSYPLVYVVVGWGVALFCGFGLMSKGNAMSVVALVFGALAVASAIYLILDLSSPYSGLFRTSPAPLQQVLAQMGQGQGAVGEQPLRAEAASRLRVGLNARSASGRRGRAGTLRRRAASRRRHNARCPPRRPPPPRAARRRR